MSEFEKKHELSMMYAKTMATMFVIKCSLEHQNEDTTDISDGITKIEGYIRQQVATEFAKAEKVGHELV